MQNYLSMQQIEGKEKELVEKLKTTFAEMQQTENEVKILQRGSVCYLDTSSRTHNNGSVGRKAMDS